MIRGSEWVDVFFKREAGVATYVHTMWACWQSLTLTTSTYLDTSEEHLSSNLVIAAKCAGTYT